MLRAMIISLCFFSSAAFAQPNSKSFALNLGTYSADLTFVKKGVRSPYDAVLFNTGKLSELKVHFDTIEQSCQIQKNLITDSCVAETEALKLEIFSLQDEIDKLNSTYKEDVSHRDKLLASLESQLDLEKKNASFEKTVIYIIGGTTTIASAVITYLLVK
jgi:uncharacterized protein YlaN (UPF0358 family)